jgi:sulfatase maturation enzyme AslB (radical SAM superfamily)
MNDYFCVLPFFGYEYSATSAGTHCCLLPNNYNIESIRNDILAGNKSPFCKACWNLEEAGLLSDRQLKNSALDFYWDRDIRFIEEDVKQGKFKELMIKNVTSNTCNSTCVTCSSGASSAWAPLEKKMGIRARPAVSMSKDSINKNIDFKELVMLNFVGGEPLYEKQNFYILEKLLENDNDKCFIAVTTNGSVDISDSNKDLLRRFKNVNFNISIDGMGPVFEYIRFPLSWNKLLENLEFFRTITDNVSVSYTTSNLNILYHRDTTAWFVKENLNYHNNPVINPKHFRPSALPIQVKKTILDRSKDNKYLELLLNNHSDQDDKDFSQFLKIIKKQDQAKEISMVDYLPEFCELIGFGL